MRTYWLALVLLLLGCSVQEQTKNCSSHDECRQISATHPLCRQDGKCVTCADFPDPNQGCQLAGDVAKPICDMATMACRGCTANSECPSQLCRTANSSLVGAGSAMQGECVAQADVVYVDKSKDYCGKGTDGDGSKDKPFCEIQTAIGKQQLILVMPPTNGSTYMPVSVSSGTAVIIGPGRDAPQPAMAVGLSVMGTADVTVDGLQFQGNVTCGSADASLTLRRSLVTKSSTDGVSAAPCKLIRIDRTWVNLNPNNGIVIGSGTKQYEIVNSLITNNGKGGAQNFGVFFGPNTGGQSSLFEFNTLVANGPTGATAGVQCGGSNQIMNSIIFSNGPMSMTQFGMPTGCTFTKVVVGKDTNAASGLVQMQPDFVGGDLEFHLQKDTDNNKKCCIDQAVPGASPPSVDFFDNARPKGNGYDVGHHEVE